MSHIAKEYMIPSSKEEKERKKSYTYKRFQSMGKLSKNAHDK